MYDIEPSDREALVRFIASITKTMREQNWHKLDNLLIYMDISELTPEIILALARTTFNVRNKLRNWNYYVTKARNELNDRGLIGEKLVEGLL